MSKSSIRRHQSKKLLRAAVAATPAVLAALSAVSSTKGAALYWDINGTAADANGATATATGTWNAALANWSTDSAGLATTTTWGGAGNTATFAAGTSQTGAYTVTVSGTNTTDGIEFQEGTVTLTGGNISLNTAGIFLNRNAASTETINSVVSGTNGLSLTRLGSTGSAILALGGANTYTGVTTMSGGNNGATLSITLNNNASLGATGAGNETVFTSTNSEAAFINLPGARLINETITVTGGAQSGVTSGQLRATAGINTWAGSIIVNGTVNNLGTGLAGIGGSGGTLVLTGQISNVGTGANTAGVVWAKTGAATLVLRASNTNVGFNRVFQGNLVIEADGALGVASTPGAFDGTTIMTTQSSSTPTIAFNHATGFSYNVAEIITTTGLAGQNGLGNGTNAMVDNFGGNNTFAGSLRIGGPSFTGPTRVLASLGARTGTSLELSGGLYASASGAGTAPNTPDPREIHKVGGGELIISGTNDTVDGVTSGDADMYRLHGNFIIDAGTLTLRNNTGGGTGSFAGNSVGPMNFQVNLGATLNLDNTAGVNTNRIGPTAAITLSAGEVKLTGNADTSVDQPGGSVNVASYSTITVTQPASTAGATTTFSLGTLSRSARGTALLRGINGTTAFAGLSGTLKGGGGAGGTTSISILTEVVGDTSSTGDGTDFVTSSGGQARVLSDGAGEYLTLASGNANLDNTKVTANTAISADTTVNSIKLTGGVTPTTVTIGGGNTLLVSSGGILGVGASGTSSAISGGKLAFEVTHIETDGFTGETSLVVDSANEGIITVPSGANLTISSVVAGDQGLTKSGRGTLRLTGTNTYGANTLSVSGANLTTINAGVLEFNTDSNLGNSAANININGGTLRPLSTSTSARAVQLSSPASNIIDTGSGADFTVTGLVTGLGLTKNGPGVLTLTNITNSYTGGTTINDGTMFLDSANITQPAWGTGGVTLNGGIIRTNVTMTLDKSLVSNSTNTTGGFYIAPGAVLTYGSSPAINTGMSGSGNYAINGGGTLILSKNNGGAMTYTGRLIVNDGSTLSFQNNGGTNDIAGIGGTPVSTAEWVVLNSNSRLQFTVTSNLGAGYSGSTRGITIGPGGGVVDITGTNIVINTAGMYGTNAATMTKDGTGLYSMRVSTGSFNGKWAINQGTLEFGNPTQNALSMGTGSGADFITMQNGTTLRTTTTSATGTMAANQGITVAGATATIATANGTTFSIPGDITAGSGKTINKTENGALRVKNLRVDTLNVNGGTLATLAQADPYSIAANAGVSKVLTVTGLTARTWDVTNAKVITQDASMPTTPVYDGVNDVYTYSGVSRLVQQGRGDGTWNGTNGFKTSQTDATTGVLTSLAVGSGAELRGLAPTQTELFGGQTINGDSSVVMYTYGGDADMDGDLDGDDYFWIDSNAPASETVFGWHQGDFNYDGRINGDDYFIIDSNTPLAQGSGLVFYVRDPEFAASGGSGATGLTAVPEPASIGLVGMGALALLGRRRRKM